MVLVGLVLEDQVVLDQEGQGGQGQVVQVVRGLGVPEGLEADKVDLVGIQEGEDQVEVEEEGLVPLGVAVLFSLQK